MYRGGSGAETSRGICHVGDHDDCLQIGMSHASRSLVRQGRTIHMPCDVTPARDEQ